MHWRVDKYYYFNLIGCRNHNFALCISHIWTVDMKTSWGFSVDEHKLIDFNVRCNFRYLFSDFLTISRIWVNIGRWRFPYNCGVDRTKRLYPLLFYRLIDIGNGIYTNLYILSDNETLYETMNSRAGNEFVST